MEDFDNSITPLVDFGVAEDKTKNIIKVIGVGGGGCNAVRNMYNEGITNVTFAVCNTDSQALAQSPIPVKVPIGKTGLGAGANPEIGRAAAEVSTDSIKRLLDDGTRMVFVTAGMGGGTGTGAAPVIAGIAKSMGILTIGIVTIPFFFEKKRKIIKALRGVDEMRRNVDALLIINNERICDIYSNSEVTIKNAFRRADQILCDATKSISELITVEGDINLDFCDVETTLRGGGSAIMAMGRARGEHRVQRAIIDALDSPLLYGNDIDKAKRMLFNIYTSEQHPLFVHEMNEIDAFMDALDANIDVIWGVSDDNTLDEDAKVTILATGFSNDMEQSLPPSQPTANDEYYEHLIEKLYHPYAPNGFKAATEQPDAEEEVQPQPVATTSINGIPVTVYAGGEPEEVAQDAPAHPLQPMEQPSQPQPYAAPTEAHGATNEPHVAAPIAPHAAAYEPHITPAAPHSVPDKEHHAAPFGGHGNAKPSKFLSRMKGLMERITELTQDPDAP